MRLSVIIPCYNDASTIGQAIASVLVQSEAVLEIIVVDDGSNDATAEVVSAFTDRRVRYMHQVNGGAGAARNTGLDHAQGDWIAFLDADDWWTPERVASARAVVAADPVVEFMQCNRLYLAADGTGTALPASAEDMVSATSLLSSFRIKTSAVMIARDLVEREHLRFPMGQKTCEDYHLFWRAILVAKRLAYVDKAEVMIRQDAGSLSRGTSLACLQQDNVKTLIEVRAWAREHQAKRSLIQALDAHLHWQLRDYLATLMRLHNFGTAMRYVGIALREEGPFRASKGVLSVLKASLNNAVPRILARCS